jgi:hypothetical protein
VSCVDNITLPARPTVSIITALKLSDRRKTRLIALS